MRNSFLIIIFGFLVCVQARAADEFDAITCGTDIPKAMIGKHSSNGLDVNLEARYSNLDLKDIGGDEISDRLSGVLWRICGKEYEELVDDKDLVRDVLPVPPASLTAPWSFLDRCRVDGNKSSDDVIAILDNAQGQKPKSRTEEIWLPAKVAWKIDERLDRFVLMPTQGLSCVADGSKSTY